MRLPATIPDDDVEAPYTDGILTLRVPMSEEETGTARTVPVKRGGTPSEGAPS
ncbi:Hsp20 family protein [Streptomyces sp. NPDC004266]|uniref:Hsp20 family protein n=1 Tax=Streptomyces sp. NPDC004266 TaxID=3364693 RepID=UPI00369A81F9